MPTDKERIESLGGSAKLAHMLGYTVQRVQNWKDRGIPAKVKLDHPEIFQSENANQRRRHTDREGDNRAPCGVLMHDHER